MFSPVTWPYMNRQLQQGYTTSIIVKTMDSDIFMIHRINLLILWSTVHVLEIAVILLNFLLTTTMCLEEPTTWSWIQQPPIDNLKTLVLHVYSHKCCLLLTPHKKYLRREFYPNEGQYQEEKSRKVLSSLVFTEILDKKDKPYTCSAETDQGYWKSTVLT